MVIIYLSKLDKKKIKNHDIPGGAMIGKLKETLTWNVSIEYEEPV